MVASVAGPYGHRADVGHAAAQGGPGRPHRAAGADTAAHGSQSTLSPQAPIATGLEVPARACERLATPAGAAAPPDEVAAAVAWLASPSASYITGKTWS